MRFHLGGVVGVQLPPGAPRAVGAGGRGGGDVLLEIQGPRAGEDPGVPLVDGFVRGDPAHTREGVAGLPPALRGLHLPGAVGRWAIPQELGQLSLLRVLLQETLYLGTKGGGDTNGDSASLRWHHPTQHHKPPELQQTDTCTPRMAGMGGEGTHSPRSGPATTLGTAMGTAMGVAVGTAVVPCTAGAYSLWRGDGSRLLALWGTRTRTFPLGTLPLLGVFCGRQDPHTPHGLPGGWGGDTKIDEQQRWRSWQGGQNRGGRWWAGVCLSPDPSAHSQGLTRTQGVPVPAIPGDRSTHSPHQPHMQRGGTTCRARGLRTT